MKKIFPFPLLFVSLVIFWLLLNGFTRGQFLIGLIVAFFASLSMKALEPGKIRIRSVPTIITLLWKVLVDILQSNIDVAKLVLSKQERRPGFVVIPLELENRVGLAILACIITATPGTAWVDYHVARRTLTIHVLDLEDAKAWRDTIKQRYEQPLIKIFGAKDIVDQRMAVKEEKSA